MFEQFDHTANNRAFGSFNKCRGTLRGLHYQYHQPQGKLLSVLEGRVFDVAVDIRPGSASFGQWMGVELSAQNYRQLYVPEGFAHGFIVLSDSALFHYYCTTEYAPQFEVAIAWNDPDIGVKWPCALNLSRLKTVKHHVYVTSRQSVCHRA